MSWYEEQKVTGSSLFAAYEAAIARKVQKDKDDYAWSKSNYRIYPTDLNTGDCPQDIIRAKQQGSSVEDVKSIITMDAGKAEHARLQGTLKRSKRYWDVMPLCYPDDPDQAAYMATRMAVIDPEIPVSIPHCGLTGRIDFPPWKTPDGYAIIDIKSLHCDTAAKFAEKTSGVIPKNFRVQLGTYAVACEDSGMFPFLIERIGIVWVWHYRNASDPATYKETFTSLTPEFKAEIRLLLKHVGRHRRAFLQDRDIECRYEQCRKHAGKKVPK